MEQYIFLKTERKIIIDEKVALYGVLGCDLYKSNGTTILQIIQRWSCWLLKCVSVMLNTGLLEVLRLTVVIETEMAVREKLF